MIKDGNIENIPYHGETFTFQDRVQRIFGPYLSNYLTTARGGTILDWGCSRGVTTVELSYLFGPAYECTGIDINAAVLGKGINEAVSYYNILHAATGQGHAVSRDEINFVEGNGYEMEKYFLKDEFSIIFLLNNLYSSIYTGLINDEELSRIIKHITSFVSPGGNVCISGTSPVGNHFMIFEKESDKLKFINSNLDSSSINFSWEEIQKRFLGAIEQSRM